MEKASRFSQFTAVLLFYTLIVILWGAWVRISGSGDGCGESWPLCHGNFVPTKASLPTWIEFSHRVSSGLYGFLVIGLVVWARKAFPKGHRVRKVAWWVLFFTITEALLGAGLVLKGLVAGNQSVARAYMMALHMFNSLLLTGSLSICFDYSRPFKKAGIWPFRRRAVAVILLFGFTAIACTGAIAALAGTLFPAESLLGGLLEDLSGKGHFLVRLRIWHPVGATVIGVAIIGFLSSIAFTDASPTFLRQRASRALKVVVLAIAFGYITLFSLSPVWMKLTHLFIAHTVWIFLLGVFFPIIRSRTH